MKSLDLNIALKDNGENLKEYRLERLVYSGYPALRSPNENV